MKRIVTIIIAAMSLGSCAAAYGWRSPFRDLPQGINLETAAAAEQKGDIARARDDYAQAVANYQKAARLGTPSSALYTKLGIVQFKLGNRGAARKSFQQAVKIDPRNADALNNIGALYCVDKKYKPALHYLKAALEINELSAPYHVNLGGAWEGLEEIDRAMTEYARALELDPDVFTTSGSGVVAQLRTPEQQARVDYLIAKAYAKRGNLEGALDFLRRASDGRYPQMSDVYVDKEFAALWQDPRLKKIVKP
ncbi:MAG: tetratricopeptide repeat protein [Terracidiphilus sp.]|jgi:tetratricopeptide (TPR) repeat protein